MTTVNPPSASRSRQALAVASWLMVGWILLGYATTVPSVDGWITSHEQTTIGRIVEGLVLILVGATGVVLWVAALRYAMMHTQKGSIRRAVLLILLVGGNFLAGFFYYFLHVVWRREPTTSSSG